MAVRAVVPTVRAMVARELRESYKMKQKDIAGYLGVTQSAISQYFASIRGNTLEIGDSKEVKVIVKGLAQILITDPTPKIICQRYCEACKIIREKRILCQLHSRLDPDFNTLKCEICTATIW